MKASSIAATSSGDPAAITWEAPTEPLAPKGSPNGEILEVIFAPVDEKEFNERVRNPAGGRGN